MMSIKRTLVAVLILGVALVGGAYLGNYLHRDRQIDDQITPIATDTNGVFVWGATVRPYATADAKHIYQSSDLEQQYQYVRDLFGEGGYVRANIETDMKVNDALVDLKEKYQLGLFLILEEIKDFNSDVNYEQKATKLAEKIVGRYKGRVEYYQLGNELTGTVVDLSANKDKSSDAGYGLTMDKNRYNNVLRYTKKLSQEIRRLDPNAKIVITGHWILIDPILDLIKDGVDTDIVGWNWGSGMSDDPGVIHVDGYGPVDIPQLVKNAGKDFWIVEANYDDGSSNNQEEAQAEYIKTIAQKAYDSDNINGYFHFILTDSREDGPGSHLGLVKLSETSGGRYIFSSLKPAYQALKDVVSGNK